MDNDMSHKTKQQVLAKLRRSYSKAGLPFKTQLLDQAVALLGYHRKAAIRALRAQSAPPRAAALLLGRPREYRSAKTFAGLKTDLVRRLSTLRLAPGRAFARMAAGLRSRSSPARSGSA